MKIAFFDTSVGSLNAGDFIIMEAVRSVIDDLYDDYMPINIPTQSPISKLAYIGSETANLKYVGGTNLLSSNMLFRKQWKINLYDATRLKDLILVGVGWWQYQRTPDFYTKLVLRNVLSKGYLHSVRDSYTKLQLSKIGISNVLNTGCPTMWPLTTEHCRSIPKHKGENVVFTLTDYNRMPTFDSEILRLLKRSYSTVYFWPQGTSDLRYLQQLDMVSDVKIISEGVSAFDDLLSDTSQSLDFVGTRLHGGVRALQNKRRSIIIGIDNRAAEKAKDFNMKVVARSNTNELHKNIESAFETKIELPTEDIEKWKNQFK